MNRLGIIIVWIAGVTESLYLGINGVQIAWVIFTALLILAIIVLIYFVHCLRSRQAEVQMALQMWEKDHSLVRVNGDQKSADFNFPDFYYKNRRNISVYVVPDENIIYVEVPTAT